MKKKDIKKFLIISLIILVTFLLLLVFVKNNNKDAIKFKQEYESINGSSSVKLDIPSNNPIVYLDTFEELNKKVKKQDSFILYLGFPACPWCRNAIPVLFDAVKENNIDNVYYINPRSLKEKSTEDFDSLYYLIYNFLLEDEEGNKVLYVPDVYFFKDGKIVGNHLDTVESQKDPSVYLTKDQVNELKGIYSDLIKKIK